MQSEYSHARVTMLCLVMVCLAAPAMAANSWDGTGDWIKNAAKNFSDGKVPTPASSANLRSGTVSISCKDVAVQNLYFGQKADGSAGDVTLNMSDGTLTASAGVFFAGHNNATMTWNLTGGSVKIGTEGVQGKGHLYLLYDNAGSGAKSSAILNITGGELKIVGSLIFADYWGAPKKAPITRKAHVQLDGGRLWAHSVMGSGTTPGGYNTGDTRGGGTLSMDITGGTLILNHRVTSMGFVTAYGGKGSFVYDYNGEIPGKTVIRATTTPPPPPPAVTPLKSPKLKITVGRPTRLTNPGSATKINTDSITASRTGVAAVFYPQGPREIRKMRVSKDAGHTWGPEREPPPHQGGAQEIGLQGGGVLKLRSDTKPTKGKPGWYDLVTFKFTDDFASYKTFTAKMYMPDHMDSLDVKEPGLSKGPIIQVPNGNYPGKLKAGDLLMPMYGGLTGDTPNVHRAYIAHSSDLGRTWSFYSTIAYPAVDPNPELPGQFAGPCEPTIAFLPNGQMIAVMRTQLHHLVHDFRPLYVAWSDDMGKTWTTPIPTRVDPAEKHDGLYNISPTLAVLDNGVIAVSYGRPGFHIAFSSDNGHSWGNIVHLSEAPTSSEDPKVITITGQFDMTKVGPNKLIAVGSDDQGVLKVWPIKVEIP